VGLCLLSTAILALSNRNLPTHSQVTDHLSDESKAQLAEVIRLRQSLGSEVWPGWDEADVPIIVYNEAYAFLVGYVDPPGGWTQMPQEQERGGPWEIVPDDDFFGEPYYRQPLPNPEITPENFTVKVGEQWVATMWTREYAEVAFYQDFQDSLPPFLSTIFPYRFMWNLIMGETDTYIAALEHESFHVFQGTVVPERLAAAEFANQYDNQYPWDDATSETAWQTEVDLLQAAVRAKTDEEAVRLAQEFLTQRDERRATIGLSADLIAFEQEREWLEGLAKYAEVTIGQVAAASPTYTPLPELATDEDFHAYDTREQYWSQQVGEIGRLSGREGGTRFYYTGMAQAILLDRLLPDWKEWAFDPGMMLEDLLREAVEPTDSVFVYWYIRCLPYHSLYQPSIHQYTDTPISQLLIL
jgi:hypothetical protein